MDEKTLSKHLQECLRMIQKKFQIKWFTKDDAIFLSRTDWVLDKLVKSGAVEIKYQGLNKPALYKAQECKHVPFQFDDESTLQCLYCAKVLTRI